MTRGRGPAVEKSDRRARSAPHRDEGGIASRPKLRRYLSSISLLQSVCLESRSRRLEQTAGGSNGGDDGCMGMDMGMEIVERAIARVYDEGDESVVEVK